MKTFAYSLLFLVFSFTQTKGNNLQITNVSINQTTSMVSFTLSWENAWRVTAAPANWDAAWVFVKWKACSSDETVAFTHGTLSSTTSDHSYTNLQAMTSVNWNGSSGITESAAQGASLDYTDGIMLRLSSATTGTVTSSVSLKVTNLPASGTQIKVKVFGIEMVYVPQGNYYLGDYDANGNYSLGRYGTSTSASAPAVSITSAYETATSTIYMTWLGLTMSSIPAAWPKGNYGFYCMKHEITEGMYAEFGNTLTRTGQTARDLGNFQTNRNQLYYANGNFSSLRPDRAQNFMEWSDVGAFLDWACLRPMTNFEFEKAARGPSTPVGLEYAWGNTTISPGATFYAPSGENGTETFTGGNCVHNTTTFSGGDASTGPARVGIFATPNTSRTSSGASYYGIMDLTGNVAEYVIELHSTGTSNTLTRTWGNGAVTSAGVHDVAGGWPADGYVPTASSMANTMSAKGGGWQSTSGDYYLVVSGNYWAYLGYSFASTIYNLQYGGRGVR